MKESLVCWGLDFVGALQNSVDNELTVQLIVIVIAPLLGFLVAGALKLVGATL